MVEKRNVSIELLRLVAAFMVILLHSAAIDFEKVNYTSFNFKVFNVYDSLVRSAVPLFLMISGAFILSNKKKFNLNKLFKKNLFKIIIIYIFWITFYTFTNHFFFDEVLSLHRLIKNLIMAPVHFWYLRMLIVLYLLTPLLVRIPRKKDESLAHYFMLFAIIQSLIFTVRQLTFLPFIPTLTRILYKINFGDIFQYITYFLLGYFIYNTKAFDKYRKLFYSLGILSFIGCVVGTYICTYYTHKPNASLYDNFTIFTFFESIAIFLFFKNHHFKITKKYKDKILSLARNTLGIYVIHILILNLLNKYTFLKVSGYNAIISVPVIAICTYGLSLLVVYILRKIKIVNKYLL